MQEFIKELEKNQAINIANNITNKIDINYVIDRLKGIQDFLLDNIEYFTYHNKNLTKAQDQKLLFIYDNLKSDGVFKD